MTANVTASINGATIGGGASGIGSGLVAGVYTIAYTTGDVLIFNDFSTIIYVDVNKGGARPTSVLVDSVTANLVNITTGNDANCTAYVVGI